MNQLPQARSREIIEQELDKELLIYDLQTNTAYSLNETSKIVYQACNGTTSFDAFKRKHKFTDDLIFFALDELNSKNLLENYSAEKFAGMNRREVIKKVGLASMVALPVIASIAAPRAANAASSGRRAVGQPCADPTNSNDPICITSRCKTTSTRTCCIPEAARDSYSCTSGNGSTDCCTGASSCVNSKCCRTANVQTCGSAGEAPQLCCSGRCSFRTINGTSAYFCEA